ncbi:RNA polymerase sigma-70 factor [Arachidicoccus ginsenosidivorans]|uniref:RNA polymerase sigma-70 factor n=1 Tax=Arachidicoccus ginsenosidivorans TaxID=496057 RepID=A0A5B8VPL6_9BACT|nr:RNA polymerase sigma-70 factor [Arachidicoccus ginsenosidivorans]QEC73574.1 RNA polymerase sigma-70 factor [Arachidicoccus ginsenosidivorans]
MQSLESYPDEQLLQLMTTGSENAFTVLYSRYHNKLYNFAFQLSGSAEEAKDVVHDVFSCLWEKRDSFQGKEIFASYLFKMIRNYSIDHLRRFSKKMQILHELTPVVNETAGADQWVICKELEQKIQASLNLLPPRQKEIFILHRQQGLKYTEIAAALGLSKSTVENHFSRAIEKLRKSFEFEYELLVIAPLLFLIWK